MNTKQMLGDFWKDVMEVRTSDIHNETICIVTDDNMKDYTRKLIESLAEEILDIQLPRLPEDITDRRYSMGVVQGFNATQEKARLKVKEIINQISK